MKRRSGRTIRSQVAITTFDYDDLGSQVLVRDVAAKDTVTASNATGQPVIATTLVAVSRTCTRPVLTSFSIQRTWGTQFDRKFIFELMGGLDSKKDLKQQIFEKGKHDDPASIALLALYLGTTARHMDNQTQCAWTPISKDDGLILSRKTGGYAVAQLWRGNFGEYRDTVTDFYGYLRDDLDAGPGRRPTWLNRYDKYNPDPILGIPSPGTGSW